MSSKWAGAIGVLALLSVLIMGAKNTFFPYELSAKQEGGSAKRSIAATSPGNNGGITTGVISGETFAYFKDTYTVLQDATNLQFILTNYYGDKIGKNSLTLKVGFQILGSATFYPVHFQGSRQIVVDPGADILTDPIGVYVKAGDKIVVQTRVEVPAGGEWPKGNQALEYVAGSASGSLDYTSRTFPLGSATVAGYSPIGVLGTVSADNWLPTVGIYGSSTFAGTNDNWRGLGAAALEGKLPYFKVAKGGEILQHITFPRLSLLKYADAALLYVTSNDLNSGHSFETIQTQLMQLFNQMHLQGIKIYVCLPMPRTTSTNSWVDLDGQTLNPVYGPGGNWEKVVEWLSSVPAPVSGVFDTLSPVEYRLPDGQRTGKWKPLLTKDGSHLKGPLAYDTVSSAIYVDVIQTLGKTGPLPFVPITASGTDAPMAAVDHDSFDRADAATLGAGWLEMENGFEQFPVFGIESNKAYNSKYQGMAIRRVADGDNFHLTANIEFRSTNQAGLAWNVISRSDFFMLRGDKGGGGGVKLFAINSGGYTNVASANVPITAGAPVKVEVMKYNGVITVKFDDATLLTYTLTAAEASKFNAVNNAGIFVNDGAHSASRWLDYTARKAVD
ncbi:hypothetical protein FE784_07445 [Paenibacillus hemerocallicola]|uniref:Uncharacterized protein n=1 Tax=Paenibacillus hemerocallicola TaxID=1172614 RepID=A0A5C4TDQ2_9BACL|nr:hypothetical protein [Paenibacillus hemerocallicola]TNJ67025.1 hypothetical protein FE784_07445 [Paenibacillus hemerocallicola]